MDILTRSPLVADHRIPYGEGPCQFGDLWLPEAGDGRVLPVVVFFHGGWWKSAYDLGYAGYLCSALKDEGIAVWSVEYRRVGATGGGWPATLQDAGAGMDFVAELATRFPLDLSRVISMGHSAGGQLAFWVAGRRNISPESEVYAENAFGGLLGAVSLAGAVDLRLTIEMSGDGMFAHDRDEVFRLMGGAPDGLPCRYAAGDPGDLLPLQGVQVLIQGSLDDEIPAELPARWAEKARRAGTEPKVMMVEGADHMDLVDPLSKAWAVVLSEVRTLLLAT